jgi:hypothetical protein
MDSLCAIEGGHGSDPFRILHVLRPPFHLPACQPGCDGDVDYLGRRGCISLMPLLLRELTSSSRIAFWDTSTWMKRLAIKKLVDRMKKRPQFHRRLFPSFDFDPTPHHGAKEVI